jgi:hypothetical protein
MTNDNNVNDILREQFIITQEKNRQNICNNYKGLFKENLVMRNKPGLNLPGASGRFFFYW